MIIGQEYLKHKKEIINKKKTSNTVKIILQSQTCRDFTDCYFHSSSLFCLSYRPFYSMLGKHR